ncbi:MAG: hypothetical protein NTAFB09_10480 [Nitrosospira sp.]
MEIAIFLYSWYFPFSVHLSVPLYVPLSVSGKRIRKRNIARYRADDQAQAAGAPFRQGMGIQAFPAITITITITITIAITITTSAIDMFPS